MSEKLRAGGIPEFRNSGIPNSVGSRDPRADPGSAARPAGLARATGHTLAAFLALHSLHYIPFCSQARSITFPCSQARRQRNGAQQRRWLRRQRRGAPKPEDRVRLELLTCSRKPTDGGCSGVERGPCGLAERVERALYLGCATERSEAARGRGFGPRAHLLGFARRAGGEAAHLAAVLVRQNALPRCSSFGPTETRPPAARSAARRM